MGISYKNWGEFYGRYQAWYWNGKRKLATCYLQANAPNILFEIAEILCATKHMPWPRNLSKVKLFHWFPFCTFPNPKPQIFLFKVLEILCGTKHICWPKNLSKVKLFHWFPYAPSPQIFSFEILCATKHIPWPRNQIFVMYIAQIHLLGLVKCKTVVFQPMIFANCPFLIQYPCQHKICRVWATWIKNPFTSATFLTIQFLWNADWVLNNMRIVKVNKRNKIQ